jgi:hypothetical protein
MGNEVHRVIEWKGWGEIPATLGRMSIVQAMEGKYSSLVSKKSRTERQG